MSQRVKEMIVRDIRTRLGDCRDMLVVNSSKLDAVSDNRLRLALRQQNIHAFTVKNSLARKALNEAGIKSLDALLDGPSTLVWGGNDVVALSKEIAKWAKELANLEIKGGSVEGKALGPEQVVALSKSPGRLELIGEVVGLALSPGRRLAAALLGPGGRIAGQIAAIGEADESGEAEQS